LPFIDELRGLLGPGGLIAGPDMAPYLQDERGLYQGVAACVALPSTAEEVAAVVRLCAQHGYAVVPQGGNTGYCGGASPDGERQVLVNLSKLNRIRAIDPVGMTATVEAGVVLASLQQAAAEQGLLFPLSMGSEGSCQLGGNLSTNAGGLAVLKYGTTRDLVLGVEVVLPNGELMNCLTSLRKDNTGYDLRSLFLGAEGSLGIITAAVVKLFPACTERQTAWLAAPDIESVCRLLGLCRKLSGDTVTSFEYISAASLELTRSHIEGIQVPLAGSHPHQVLLELSAPLPAGALLPRMELILEQALGQGLATDGVLAQSDRQRQHLWRIRESIPEAEKHAGRSVKHDVSVPIASIPAYLSAAAPQLADIASHRPSIYGHIGDGNLHYNILAPEGSEPGAFRAQYADVFSDALHQLAAELSGSFSAEHGIGKLKVADLERYKDAAALRVMAAIKAAIDPAGTMNPGKVLRQDGKPR